MNSVDWGVETESLHIEGIADARFAPIDADDPWEVPAVRAAGEQGYEPAPEAPLWIFLPAVWPLDARAWVPDSRVRHMQVSCQGEPLRRVPWSAVDYFEMETDANWLLVECGLPERPAGRIWLLKPPSDIETLEVTLSRLVTSANDAAIDIMASPAFVAQVQHDLAALFASGS